MEDSERREFRRTDWRITPIPKGRWVDLAHLFYEDARIASQPDGLNHSEFSLTPDDDEILEEEEEMIGEREMTEGAEEVLDEGDFIITETGIVSTSTNPTIR